MSSSVTQSLHMFKGSLNCKYFLNHYMPSVTIAVKHLSKISKYARPP